jgi:hypothetical protein
MEYFLPAGLLTSSNVHSQMGCDKTALKERQVVAFLSGERIREGDHHNPIQNTRFQVG